MTCGPWRHENVFNIDMLDAAFTTRAAEISEARGDRASAAAAEGGPAAGAPARQPPRT